MTDTTQLALDGLTYDPPPAAVRGDQTLWWCQHCGSVLVQSSYNGRGKPKGECPICATHSWRKASLPIVGLDHARCDACDRLLDVETGGRL